MLTGVILAKNEEERIGKAIDSLNICDEILVIDDYSSDNTVQIAKKHGAKVIKRRLNKDFANQRNFAMGESRGEWILFVDADEKVSEKLAKEITSVVSKKDDIAAFYIKRRDIWWGRKLMFGEGGTMTLIRLVKKNTGKWVGRIHERFETSGSTAVLKNHLLHHPHPTVTEFLREINEYSTIRADELYNKGKKVGLFEIVSFPLGKFILNYFLKLGFLDGPAGFVYAFFMSFHSFLVRTKLYIRTQEK